MSKKGSATQTDQNYTPGDVVLAKIKGYPAWPGQIINNDNAPLNVRREKPTKNKTYLVRFFPTGDYAWTTPRDLSSLSSREIEAYISSPAKKSGDLLDGYKIAADPSDWLKEREDEAAAANAFDDEDQLASGDEASGSKATKKRKAGATKKDPAEEKKAKKAKLEKLAKSRAPAGASKKSEKAAADSSSSSNKPKAAPAAPAAAPESEDPGLKQVRDWRHKLQKVFLGKGPLNSDEMPKCREYFDAMEDFDMKREWLLETKLAKVLKRIVLIADGEIPDEATYKFRERSTALAQKWGALAASTNGNDTHKDDGAASENHNHAAPSTETPNDSTAAAVAPTEDDKTGKGATHSNGTNGEAKTAEATTSSTAAEPIAA